MDSPSPSARYRPEINWIQIVYNEIVSVMNTMKRNQRWSSAPPSNATRNHQPSKELSIIGFKSGDSGNNSGVENLKQFLHLAKKRPAGVQGAPLQNLSENKLINDFITLKQKLGSITNLRDLDPSDLLKPFLQVIKSGDTTGNITGAALISIQNFVNYRILDPHHPDIGLAVVTMTHAVTRCKFEATDVVSDEIVLTNILRLLTTIAVSEAGKKCITDKCICEMVEVAFGMHFQARISELLRKTAEETLLVLTQCLFERLVVITREAEHRESMKDIGKAGATRSTKAVNPLIDSAHHDLNGIDGMDASKSSPKKQFGRTAKPAVGRPFGIPAILEFTRVIITLIDPKDNRHTDMLHRALALRLVTRALEVGGQSLSKWVEAGFLIEKELERTPHKERNEFHETIDPNMMIVTEQPATLVSVTANGANYSEISSPKAETLDGEASMISGSAEQAENKPLLSEVEVAGLPVNDPAPAPSTPTQVPNVPISTEKEPVQNGDKESTQNGELKETDFQNLAISIKHMIVQDLTRHLFQLLLVQNTTNFSPPSWSGLSTIGLVLRTISTLFSSMREHMIPQQQWFIQHLIKSCTSGVSVWGIDDWASSVTGTNNDNRSSSDNGNTGGPQNRPNEPILVSEVRELFLEALLQMCRSDTLYNELYMYHDTNVYDKTRLFEDLIKFFAKFTFPDSSPGGYVTNASHQMLSFDGVLMFLRCLADRRLLMHTVPQVIPSDEDAYTPEHLISNKERKEKFLAGAELFNQSAKKGIAFFQENGFLPDPITPKALAQFMFSSANLSKSVIGEYIAKRDDKNIETLKEFVELFNFEGRRIDEAMRLFLEKFRIPGEAQQIERVLDAFSKRYYQTISNDPEREITTEDDTGVLAFSIIMLNTDQHNPQVRKRMVFEDYKRNVRGLNSGKDFAVHYLQSIYNAIQQNEIVLAEERGGDLGFNYEWKELLKTMDEIPHFSTRDTNVYDKDLFVVVSVPVLASVFYVFENAQDSATFEKSLLAIQHAALIAVRYQLRDILDFIIVSLIRVSTFSKASRTLPLERDLFAPLPAGDEERPNKADRWAVDIGQNYRCQVAAVTAFNFVKDFSDSLRDGWKSIIASLSNLFLHQVLPASFMSCEHFFKGKIMISRLEVNQVSAENAEDYPKREQGLFSSFAQFLSLSSSEYDDDFDNPQTRASHIMTIECVSHCEIEDILDETRFMEDSTVLRLLDYLIKASFNEKKADEKSASFSLSSVFLLEIIFKIALRNRDRLQSIWPSIALHLKNVVAIDSPATLLERASTNVLRLLLRLTHVPELQAQVFESLNLLLNLKSESIQVFVDHLMAGFLAIAKTDMSILSKQPSRWTILFRILSISTTHPIASSYSFEFVCLIVSGHPDSPVTAEHFGECVDLLLSFSSGIPGNVSSNNLPKSSPQLRQQQMSSPARKEVVEVQEGLPISTIALDRALKAIEKLYNLHNIIPKLIDTSGAQSQRAWFEFWLPVLSGLGQQCSHPCADIRHQSLSFLQRILLSDELSLAVDQNHELQHRIDCFDIVLFPILEELGNLDTKSDPLGASETFVRTCVLITKVFLHFSPFLSSSKEYNRLWGRILDYFGYILQSSSILKRNDYAAEGVQESLKNAILVLMAEQVIMAPSEATENDKNSISSITWTKIDSFYPTMKNELIISAAPRSPPTQLDVPVSAE